MPTQEVRYGELVLHTRSTWYELDPTTVDRLQAADGPHDPQDVQDSVLEPTLLWVNKQEVGGPLFDTWPVDARWVEVGARAQVDLLPLLREGRASDQGGEARPVVGPQAQLHHLDTGPTKVRTGEDGQLSGLLGQALEARAPEAGIQEEVQVF